MSEWRGFVEESKSYWGYPTGRAAVRFWLFFPRAWFRFFILIPVRQTLRVWWWRLHERRNVSN